MQYMALIYDTPQNREAMTKEQTEAMMAGFTRFNEQTKAAGVFVAGDALESVHSATTIRIRDGKVLTTDGPFAETKEQLGGYYLLECKDLDEALRWAAKIPTASYGSVEVRPLMVW